MKTLLSFLSVGILSISLTFSGSALAAKSTVKSAVGGPVVADIGWGGGGGNFGK